MSKSATYCRLLEEYRNKSSAEDNSANIQNQKSMLLQYVIQQGREVFHIYSNDDYMGFSTYGESVLSALWITQIPTTRQTKSPAKSTAWSTSGTWRISQTISVASSPTAGT